jgi:hypothetical protein
MSGRPLQLAVALVALTLAAHADTTDISTSGFGNAGDPNDLILINDAFQAPTVTLGGNASGTIGNVNLTTLGDGEILTFTYTLAGTGVFGSTGDTFDFYSLLYEPWDPSQVSDTFRFQATGGTSTATITFASDTSIDLTGSTQLVSRSAVETGLYQTMLSFGPPNPTIGDISGQFEVASAPEPSTVAPIGMALIGIGLGSLRRRQNRQ